MKYLFFVLFLVSCTHQKEIQQTRSFPSRIIDAHIHVESGKPLNGEFSKSHVVGAVVHSSLSEPVPNQALLSSGLKLAVCAAVSEKGDFKKVEQALMDKRCHCLKIYLGYVPKYATDRFYTRYYRLAEKYNVPVVFHTGDTYDKKAKVKYADPLTVDEVAVEFPKVKFVLAHLGNPWLQSAAEVVYKNDNVYADTSALLLGDVSKIDSESVEQLLVNSLKWFYLYVENPKKILFGTDWPLVSIKPYVEAVQKAIPEKHWDDIFYKNAISVFNLALVES